MNAIRNLGFGSALFSVIMIATSAASAATIKCPDPVGTTQDRQYQTTGATDCVWGDGNIGQGQPANDAFLLGNGTNDAMYGDFGPTFGKTWTTITSVNYPDELGNAVGISFSNVDGNSADWTLTDTSYLFYALGLKDGGTPKWAVFLLDSTSGTADIISQGGSWSHFVLYGSGKKNGGGGGGGGGNVPEPMSLALFGIGLVGLGLARRRSAR